MTEGNEVRASRGEVEGRGRLGRGRRSRLIRVAVFSSLGALLLIAGPGGAFAQTPAQEQYAAQDQYSDGGVQQTPVGPGDPAHPRLASQPPQTFGQTLADVSAELDGISQGLAALGQTPAPNPIPADAQAPAAPDPNAAVPAFSAPTTAVVGGASPGSAPVAVVDPYSAAVNAASAVGAGAPGYTTTSGQTPLGVAVLGGVPQDRQVPVAVVDPFSAVVSAASPSVPGQTAQAAQYLQQLLTLRGLLDAQQALQQGPAGEAQLRASLEEDLDQDEAGWYAVLAAAQGSTEPISPETGTSSSNPYAALPWLTQQTRDHCSLSAQIYGNTPDSMGDGNTSGNDPADIAAACGPSPLTSEPSFGLFP